VIAPLSWRIIFWTLCNFYEINGWRYQKTGGKKDGEIKGTKGEWELGG